MALDEPIEVADKLARLEKVVGRFGRALTAFSAGVDSTLVAAVANKVLGKENAPAIIGDSPSLPRQELEQAKQLALEMGLALIVITPNEQDDPGYQANAGNRCYFCKTHLYDALQAYAGKHGYHTIFNGTNTDDLGDHRPGLVAADEAKVVSPLVEAGLTKADVRAVAQAIGLPNWDKPAAACLASRIPYGTPVTRERLAQVEQAEQALQGLGFVGFRVRHHEQVARIELPLDQMQQILDDNVRLEVAKAVKAAGFLYVSLDIEGFRSGSGNVALTISGANV